MCAWWTLDDLGRIALHDDAALLDEDGPVAVLRHPGHVVGHEHDRLGRLDDLDDAGLRLGPERGVAGRQDLVEQQDVRVDRGRDGEPEPGTHAGRVRLERGIDELAELRVLDDRRQEPSRDRVVQAQERPAEQDVVAAAQLLVEPRAEGEQPGHVPPHVDRALRRADDPGQDLEERALAGAVRTDDGQRLAVEQAQRHVLQRPEALRAASAEHLPDRAADRRLPGESQVVPDAEVLGDDGRLVRADDEGRWSVVDGHHRTFAKRGSSRLKATAPTARNPTLKIPRPIRGAHCGKPGSSVVGVPQMTAR